VKTRDIISATLPKPAAVPPARADAFLDDVPKAPANLGVPMGAEN